MVERLLKALREARPATVRQFFSLAAQHIRWELNDLARRLDEQAPATELGDRPVPAPAGSDSALSPDARLMLDAIGQLPDDDREAFDLVRIQGLTQPEAAEVLGVSVKTVQRRLNRARLMLAEKLDDLLQLALGVLHVGDVVEGDAHLVPLVAAGGALDVVGQEPPAERVAEARQQEQEQAQ